MNWTHLYEIEYFKNQKKGSSTEVVCTLECVTRNSNLALTLMYVL